MRLIRVNLGFSLITAEDRVTIMNVPERTTVAFFLPHSNTSAYVAIVSINNIPQRTLAHTPYSESQHQGGVRYRYRATPDEDIEAIAHRSDVAPPRRQRPGFFQDYKVFNRIFSYLSNNSPNLKTFHAVLCFNNFKSARSHTFRQALTGIRPS